MQPIRNVEKPMTQPTVLPMHTRRELANVHHELPTTQVEILLTHKRFKVRSRPIAQMPFPT